MDRNIETTIETMIETTSSGFGGNAEARLPAWRNFWRSVRALGHRVLEKGRRQTRQLSLSETLSLGDRRFIAVIEFERRRFLVGGTASSVVLLARLDEVHSTPHPRANTRAENTDVERQTKQAGEGPR